MQGDMVSREDLELELQEIEAHAPGQIEGVCASGGLQRATQAKRSARTAGSDKRRRSENTSKSFRPLIWINARAVQSAMVALSERKPT
jgi:hypothetical protein